LKETEEYSKFSGTERVKCGILPRRSYSELNVDGADVRLFDLIIFASALPRRYLGTNTNGTVYIYNLK